MGTYLDILQQQEGELPYLKPIYIWSYLNS